MSKKARPNRARRMIAFVPRVSPRAIARNKITIELEAIARSGAIIKSETLCMLTIN